MNTRILSSEKFAAGKRNYFVDIRRASNFKLYLKITGTEKQADGNYQRFELIVFQKDMNLLIQACSLLFETVIQKRKPIGHKELLNMIRGTDQMGNPVMEMSARILWLTNYNLNALQKLSKVMAKLCPVHYANANVLSALIASERQKVYNRRNQQLIRLDMLSCKCKISFLKREKIGRKMVLWLFLKSK